MDGVIIRWIQDDPQREADEGWDCWRFPPATGLWLRHESCESAAMTVRTRTAIGLGVVFVGLVAACDDGASTSDPGRVSQYPDGANDGGADASLGDDSGGGVVVPGTVEPDSLALDCGAARVTLPFGARLSIPCRLEGTLPNGTKAEFTSEARWSLDDLTLASVSSMGEVGAYGTKGGHLTVTAVRGALRATASIDLDLLVARNTANVSAADLVTLRTGTTAASGMTWAYPYDRTVFPRGLPSPKLMWNGGPDAATIFVELKAANARLESVVTRERAGKAAVADADWAAFEESAAGPVSVTVKALVAGAAQVLVTQTWTVAPGSLRGSVYYWAANVGRVLRLKPGRSAPEDFAARALGTTASCTTTCHTVSANGSTFLSGGDELGGTYDLRTDTVNRDVGGTPGSNAKRRFAYGGVSADGRFVTESYAPLPVGFADAAGSGGQGGLFLATTLAKVPNSGLDGIRLGTPAFSADDHLIAFTDYYATGGQNADQGVLKILDWDSSVPRATNLRTLVSRGSGQPLHFPSVSPDHALVAYHRGGLRTDGGSHGDLYAAFTAQAGQEVRLAAANGDGTTLPAGARDQNWNFEPTFAPRASGGYFWAVFTSRRTFGNELTVTPDLVKQLWVTAIDVNPQPGVDPSHPAFRLPGQAGDSLNLRGFCALDPCKSDGQGCGDGSECCGGFCSSSSDAGAPVCSSTPPACSRDGDRCSADADCCTSGARCIANACSAPPPR